jgi:hypothetical protein
LPFRFCGHENNCDITLLTAELIESDGLRNSITRLPTVLARPFAILNLGEPTYPAFYFMKFAIVLFLCLPACAQTWFTNVTKSPTTNSCAIGWTTAVPTIAHIQYGLAAGSYTKLSANSTQYLRSRTATISGLTAGTTYHFRIVAADASNDWINSLDYTCTTTKTTTAQHSVRLNWQASSSTGVTGYRVYRSTIPSGYYALLASPVGLTYTDTAVQSGATYYYVLSAINSAGQHSAYSTQVKAVIP